MQPGYLVLFNTTRIELYIDTPDAQENKRVFEILHAQKAAIEQVFGAPLDWQRLDDRKASRISWVLSDGGLLDRGRWPQIQDQMIDAMLRLEAAFRPQIQALRRS